MVKAEEYKGIEFIRISRLPENQALQIKKWCKGKKITILNGEEMWRDCIQYKHYKEWYNSKFDPNLQIETNGEVNEQNSSAKKSSSSRKAGALNFFKLLLS